MTADFYGVPVPIGWLALGLVLLGLTALVQWWRGRKLRRFHRSLGGALRGAAGATSPREHEQLP